MPTWRWLLLFSLGCTSSSSTVWTPPEQESLTVGWTDCSDGETCVLIELGCCDHCNGGSALSVRADAAAEAEEAFAETCDGTEDCTLMGCGELSAACEDGSCVLLQEAL